jgi:hypothetical protein
MKNKSNKSELAKKRGDWLNAASKRRFATEDLPEAIVAAARTAKMDKRHDGLNKLLLVIPGERGRSSREGRGPRS